MNLEQYLPILLFILVGIGVGVVPQVLGFILGPMLEENFRRALLLSRGSFIPFFTRPISGTLFALIGIFIVWQVAAFFLQSRKTTVHDQQPA